MIKKYERESRRYYSSALLVTGAASGLGRTTAKLLAELGGEVALLGGEGYSAWQPGAVLEFHNGAGRILGLGAGMKIFDGGDDAFYVRVEGVLPLSRR